MLFLASHQDDMLRSSFCNKGIVLRAGKVDSRPIEDAILNYNGGRYRVRPPRHFSAPPASVAA